MMKKSRAKYQHKLLFQGSKLKSKISSIYHAQTRGRRNLKIRRHSNFVWFILARKVPWGKCQRTKSNLLHFQYLFPIQLVHCMSRNVADMQKFEIWGKFSSLQPDQQGICDLWLEFFNFSRPNHGHDEFVFCYWIFVILKTLSLVLVIGICDLWLSRLQERNL